MSDVGRFHGVGDVGDGVVGDGVGDGVGGDGAVGYDVGDVGDGVMDDDGVGCRRWRCQ